MVPAQPAASREASTRGWPWVCLASVAHTSPCAAAQLGHGLVEILSSLAPFPWETVRGLPPQQPLVGTGLVWGVDLEVGNDLSLVPSWKGHLDS